MKTELQISHTNSISQDMVFNQTPLSSTHVVYYEVLIIHKSNIPFLVARHKYIMKCDKDILQPFFEDLNKFMSPLVIGYHSVNSVTVRSSTRHQVCGCCQLSRPPRSRKRSCFPYSTSL